jgi:hypothetical protein
MPKPSELALKSDTLGIVWRIRQRVEWCSTLRLGVVVGVAEVTVSVIMPSGNSVDEPSRIELAYSSCNSLLGLVALCELNPTFVVDDPSDNGWIVLVLVDEDFYLALKLALRGASGVPPSDIEGMSWITRRPT